MRSKRPDARLIVAASDTDANMLWATRLFAPDPFIFIQKGSRRYVVMSDLEIDRARSQASVDRVLGQSDYVGRIQARGFPFPTTAQVVAAVFEDLSIRTARVPTNFPVGIADSLRTEGVRIEVQADPFWPNREIKSGDEVRAIRASLRAAESGMEAGIAALRRCRISPDGFLSLGGTRLTSEILKSVINSRIMEQGYVPSHTIVSSGEQGVDPHNEGSGPIRAHSPVIMDIFPRSQKTGYFGDMTRTVVRGRATDLLRRAYGAVAAAQKIGFRRIRPRASAYDIHSEIVDFFNRQGFETGIRDGRMQGFFHGTGHGLGLDIHEAPSFGTRARNRFRKNQVVTVEPGLYYSGMGGIRLEDVVLVTSTGCRNLVRFPKTLEV
jgi:Xaa-Pro aminopeptidase